MLRVRANLLQASAKLTTIRGRQWARGNIGRLAVYGA
jgi:hypothetical protein